MSPGAYVPGSVLHPPVDTPLMSCYRLPVARTREQLWRLWRQRCGVLGEIASLTLAPPQPWVVSRQNSTGCRSPSPHPLSPFSATKDSEGLVIAFEGILIDKICLITVDELYLLWLDKVRIICLKKWKMIIIFRHFTFTPWIKKIRKKKL
jgi:hypothetical protein